MGAFEERYAKLNPEQKKAVDAIDGPVLVIAGPGSGKTELLSLRVAKILKDTDASAGSILCLTFTDAAALNMRERLAKLIGSEAYRVGIHTFHGFATSVIERYPEYFFGGALFSPADDVVQLETMRSTFESLSHDNPLRSFHPEQGFVYSYDAKRGIDHLKRAGMSPAYFRKLLDKNEAEFKNLDKALAPFESKISKTFIGEAGKIQKILVGLAKGNMETLAWSIGESLAKAIHESEILEKTAPLSDWKRRHMKKTDEGKLVLKERVYHDKLCSLALVYEKYQEKLHSDGYFDFGDMIMRLAEALENEPSLLYELQEKYQYILTDEFQDTNGAQMAIIKYLTSAEVHEGRPNILAVGDDDQAIYKFQGAELSNILAFKSIYKNPEIVVLTKNYRSTQNILNVAGEIAKMSTHRLVGSVPGLIKDLVSSNKVLPAGDVSVRFFETPIHEYRFIAKETQKLIDKGISPHEIAVIAREHAQLKDIVPFFHRAGISVSYERQRNVLHERHVSELITLSRYILSRLSHDPFSGDFLLPEILSYPFWRLSEKDIWEVAKVVRKENISWTEALEKVSVVEIQNISKFLSVVRDVALRENLHKVLDVLIGSGVASVFDEESENNSNSGSERIISPFREYYFGEDKLNKNKAEYLSFLSSLRVFVSALREYKSGKPLLLKDLVEFVDIREKNKLPLLDDSPFARGENSIQLMTAHKAKGQEFEVVFVISGQDGIWAGGTSGSKLPFPANLPVEPDADSFDDTIRLFYVALTRARHTLYVTYYEKDMQGKESLPLRLIPQSETKTPIDVFIPKKGEFLDSIETLEEAQQSQTAIPKTTNDKELLLPLVENYRMSVTLLNNFLDVTKGGPRFFFEQNLLLFPQAKSPSGSFGTAIHATFERIYSYLRREGKMPVEDEILSWFNVLVKKERMSASDEKHYVAKGEKILSLYLEKNIDVFNPEHRIEVNFKNQGVSVGDAVLSGKIDRIEKNDDGVIVFDLKTGKPAESWEASSQDEKIKLHRYKRQLLFYKILVEGSTEFKNIEMVKGVLEFLEPKKNEFIKLEAGFEKVEVERLKEIIKVVDKKIKSLDFPDTSKYPQTLEGIEGFEEDLLNGKI